MPCTSSGSMKSQKLASAVKPARIRKETPKATKATVAMMRASILAHQRRDSGVSSTATTPVGAATSPAQVAV